MKPFPSPAWLCTPAHPGFPTPEEKARYKAYLSYQIKRGVCPGASGHASTGVNSKDGMRNLGHAKLAILRVLLNGDADRVRIIEESGEHNHPTQHLAELVTSAYITRRDGAKVTWSITEKGRHALAKAAT